MTSFIQKFAGKIVSSVLVATLAVAFLPLAASAQDYSAQGGGQEIVGTIQSIDGTFNITVLDQNGNVDAIELHQGTIINPTGLTLAPGMSITILGYDNGNVFEANEIDTPYHYSGALPTPVYYGAGFWYPGFAYGYGPSFSLVFASGGYVVRQPWGGRWWAPRPVLGINVNVGGGYRYPESRGGYTRPGYAAPTNRYAPRYSAPAQGPAYRYPAARTAPTYRAPETSTRSYGGGSFQRYSAPQQRYSAPQQRYSAPAQRYNASAGARYSGGARYSTGAQRSSSGGGHYSGGSNRGQSNRH